MKKITLFMFCMLFYLGAVAQVRPSFFVKAGVNVSDFWGSDIGDYYNSHVGFRAGFGSILPINDLIAIQPTLYLSQKGIKTDENQVLDVDKATANAWYLDLPIDLQFRFHAGNVVLTPAIGPYFAYGIFGKMKNDNTGESINTFKDGNWKRFDCGLNVEFGVEFSNNIMLSASYQMGFTKVHDFDDSTEKIHNETLNMSVGYKF